MATGYRCRSRSRSPPEGRARTRALRRETSSRSDSRRGATVPSEVVTSSMTWTQPNHKNAYRPVGGMFDPTQYASVRSKFQLLNAYELRPAGDAASSLTVARRRFPLSLRERRSVLAVADF